jgi:CheY-like chemotaxis protein
VVRDTRRNGPLRAQHPSILVVDSDRRNAEVIAAILGDEGYAACQATETTTALARIAQEHPAVIILDATLRHLTPSGLRGFLDAHSLPHPAIICSTTEPAHVPSTCPGDPDGWLLKPFTIASLLSCVEEALLAAAWPSACPAGA